MSHNVYCATPKIDIYTPSVVFPPSQVGGCERPPALRGLLCSLCAVPSARVPRGGGGGLFENKNFSLGWNLVA